MRDRSILEDPGGQVDIFRTEDEKGFNLVHSPIPLTEEWLLKFAFNKIKEFIKYGNGYDWKPDYPRTIYNPYVINLENDKCFGIVGETVKWMGKQKIESDVSCRILLGNYYETSPDSSDFIYCEAPKYVHSLQNLFFALCGKELELITNQ